MRILAAVFRGTERALELMANLLGGAIGVAIAVVPVLAMFALVGYFAFLLIRDVLAMLVDIVQ